MSHYTPITLLVLPLSSRLYADDKTLPCNIHWHLAVTNISGLYYKNLTVNVGRTKYIFSNEKSAYLHTSLHPIVITSSQLETTGRPEDKDGQRTDCPNIHSESEYSGHIYKLMAASSVAAYLFKIGRPTFRN